VFLLLTVAAGVAKGSDGPDQRLEKVIQEFRARLGITERVLHAIVEVEDYLVSVRRSPGERDVFVIRIEQRFLEPLSDEDLRAVIAHEMGHVWIFTHHPYLQTEALANQKALELVSRESLVRVYEKVWQRGGWKGTLEDFLARVR
jgi:hypothetical protein